MTGAKNPSDAGLNSFVVAAVLKKASLEMRSELGFLLLLCWSLPIFCQDVGPNASEQAVRNLEFL